MENFDVQSLMVRGLIPNNVRKLKHESVARKCVPVNRALSRTQDQPIPKLVVADRPIWVACCGDTVLYSCDGEFVYKYDNESFKFTQYLVKDKLIPIKILNLQNHSSNELNSFTKFKEEEKMNNQAIDSALDALVGSLGSESVGGSEVFTSTPAVADADKEMQTKLKEAKLKGIQEAISAETSKVATADLRRLHAYNFAQSEIIGWITGSEPRTRAYISSKKSLDPESKEPMFRPGTSQDIINKFKAGDKVDSKYFLYDTDLVFKQNAPGPLKYAVIKFPKQGLVELDDLRNPEANIVIDPKKETDYIIHMLSKDSLINFMSAYIGEYIKECPATHDNPSTLSVKRVISTREDKVTGETRRYSSVRMKVADKSVIQPKNFFPLTVYNTISLADLASASQEMLDKANYSFFHGVFNNNTDGRGYDNLNPTKKALVTKQDGKIISKFLDPSANEPINVKDWYTKEVIANPSIPLKTQSDSKNKDGKITYKFDKYDAVKGGAPELAHLDPFTSGKYTAFLQACEGKLTKESLTELLSKGKASKKKATGSSVELSAEDNFKIFLEASQNGGIANIELDKGIHKGDAEKLADDIFTLMSSR